MIAKAKGITLGYHKYLDTSVIARVYTREFGLISLIVGGIRSQKSKRTPVFFESLNILNVVFYLNNRSDLYRCNEYKSDLMVRSIRTEPLKNAIAVFLAEFLWKIMQVEKQNQVEIFEFLASIIKILETANKDYYDLHLKTLLKLTHYLGFGLVRESVQMNHNINDKTLDKIENLALHPLIRKSELNGQLRFKILNIIIDYYTYHLGINIDIKSLKVLTEIIK